MDAPTKSIHDGKLYGSKREHSSFYVIPPCQHPNYTNNDRSQKQNWSNHDKVTFEFRPESSAEKFSVFFVPVLGVQAVAAEYQYQKYDAGSDGDFSGEFTGNGAVYDLGSCADIYVTVETKTMTPAGVLIDAPDDAVKQSGEIAKKYALDIAELLRAAIGPVCKNSPTPPPPIRYEDPDDPLFPTTWPPEPQIIDRPPPAPLPVGMRKLVMYYNYQHHDSATLSTDDAIRAAVSGGYRYAGDAGGYVYAAQALGTVPLKLFYSESRKDYFTTATDVGERAALASNYRLLGIEGYVFPIYQPLTAQLKLFWAAEKADNLTIATPGGEASALKGGYVFAWTDGYIPKSTGSGSNACGLGTRWEVKDNVSTSSWNRRGNSNTFDSRTVLQSGQFVEGVVTLGIVGNQVTAQRNHANWGTCNYTGTLSSDGTSVTGTYSCPDQVRHDWRGTIRCN